MIKQALLGFKKLIGNVDSKLLIFLILFLNIKLPVKIAALVLIYILQFDFKFGFKFKKSRLPLFYLLVIPISVLGLLINHSYDQHNYLPVYFTGLGCWLMSILAVHQMKLSVERNSPLVIHQTLVLFFIINALVSLSNLAYIVYQTGSINPYTFTGMYRIYFINTGDDIKGISFDISCTNAVTCAFGTLYFLIKEKPLMLIICACTMLLTYSNLVTILLAAILLLLFIFNSTKIQKSLIVAWFGLFMIFMVKVSPQNKNYVVHSIENVLNKKNSTFYLLPTVKQPLPLSKTPDNLLSFDERRQKHALHYLDSIARTNYPANGHPSFTQKLPTERGMVVAKIDTIRESNYLSKAIEPERQLMRDFISKHRKNLPLATTVNYAPVMPGKIIAALQSITYLKNNPTSLIAGAGIGDFSSKIAFRATGLGTRGRYPAKYVYINPAFLSNHLDLYMSFFSKDIKFRSVVNNPYSVYDQMLTEYGLLGLSALMVYYFGFFIKKKQALTYGLPILIFTIGICFIDYWFEQLSVLILFELMLFLNIKETAIKNESRHE